MKSTGHQTEGQVSEEEAAQKKKIELLKKMAEEQMKNKPRGFGEMEYIFLMKNLWNNTYKNMKMSSN